MRIAATSAGSSPAETFSSFNPYTVFPCDLLDDSAIDIYIVQHRSTFIELNFSTLFGHYILLHTGVCKSASFDFLFINPNSFVIIPKIDCSSIHD